MNEPLDQLDQLAQGLFRAAREEPLPDDALVKALLSAKAEARAAHSLPRSARWVLPLAVVALAASVALWARRHDSVDHIRAEPSAVLLRAHSAPSAAAAAQPTPVVPSPVPASKPAPSTSALTPAPSVQVSLSDELGALTLASSALNAGNTGAALSALDRYDHVLKGKKMRAEATLLRIEALSRSGQAAAAGALAKHFAERYPESPLADRARSFVQ